MKRQSQNSDEKSGIFVIVGNKCFIWKSQSQERFSGTRALGMSVKVVAKLKSHSLGCSCL